MFTSVLAHFKASQQVQEEKLHILGVRIWGDVLLNTFYSEIQVSGGKCSSNDLPQVMESTALILKSTLE